MRFIETIVKEVYRNYRKKRCIETIVKEVYRNYSKIGLYKL